MSKASDIAEELDRRVARIRNGTDNYETDIGKRILRGRLKFDDSLTPCTVLVEDEDNVVERIPHNSDKVKLEQTYFLEGHAECDPDNPNDLAHQMIADLKRAVFGGEPKLGGLAVEVLYLGRTIVPREDGAGLVAASIEIAVSFVEQLSAP